MTTNYTDTLSVRSDTAAHTVTFWHGTLKLSRPVPAAESSNGEEGWWTEEHASCPHNHTSREAADLCSDAANRHAMRTGFAPKGWTR